MNEYKINVCFENNKIITTLGELVQNDYNSTKLKFAFDKNGSRFLFKLKYPDNTVYVDEIVNNELILGAGVLNQSGYYKYEICLYDTDNRLTDYAIGQIYVRTELVSTDEIVEPDDRVPILDNLINEVNENAAIVANIEEQAEEIITEANNLDLDVSKEGKTATVTLTKKDATTKTVTLSDGTSLMFNWDGTKLGIKTDEDADYTYVDLQGVQGPIGPKGEAFTIKKTYSSVSEMNADFYNMQLGDYVMIASTVEVEDNAKLYTRGESQWIFISDFSGAQGIKGETGATPNIQIGTVTSGVTPSVTRTGTNENPILNFVLEKGQKGDTGDTGETGPTGNGIASITKTSTSGLVDTYTITYTDGTTTTFEVTNGEDGEVTQAQLDALQREVDYNAKYANALIKESATGTSITINDTAECPMPISLGANTEQASTTGKNKFDNSIPRVYRNQSTVNKAVIDSGVKAEYTGTGGTTNLFFILLSLDLTNYVGSTIRFKSDFTISGSNKGAYSIGLIESDGSNRSSKASTLISGEEISFVVPELSGEQKYLGIWFYVNTDNATLVANDYVDYKNVLLTIDNADMTYEPFTNCEPAPSPSYPFDTHTISGNNTTTITNSDNTKSQVLPLNLDDLEYCKIGNYEDKFYKATASDTGLTAGKWYLKKNTSKKVLNGNSNEVWSRQSSSTLTSYFQCNSVVSLATAVANLPLGYTNYFTKNTGSILGTTDGITGFTFNTSGYFRIRIENTNATTVDQLRSWLSTHNLIAYYPIATPEYILLNDTLQEELNNIYKFALSYEEQTNISQVNDDLPFVLNVSGVKDLNKLINDLTARIESLETDGEA